MLEVVHGSRKRALTDGCDALFHLLRAQTCVVERGRDHRDIDCRENVGGYAENDYVGGYAENDYGRENQNQQCQDDECIRPGRGD